MIYASGYIKPLFSAIDRKKIISNCIKTLKPIADTFDTIAISGYSMALITPIIADKLKKQIVLVRKKEESSHAIYPIEGLPDILTRPYTKFNYIIIDDLIDTGKTVNKMISDLSPYGKCMGIYLYNAKWGRKNNDISHVINIPFLGSFKAQI